MKNLAPAPIHPLLAERWSPRAFDAEAVLSEPELAALAEWARKHREGGSESEAA